jgi:hypothetical protein
MYKITVTYDEAKAPNHTFTYADELEAFKNYLAFVDWGFANEYSTVNLYTPSLKCYTKIFYREGRRIVER